MGKTWGTILVGISSLLVVGTTFTGSGNLYYQWELSPGSRNALCILFPTRMIERIESLRTMTNTHSGMTPAAIKEMINRRVAEALEAHEINRNLGLENLNGNHNDRNRNRNGNGIEGVVGLIRWCEKMETVFHISNYSKRYQVKTDAAYTLSWRELMKLMTEVYCPRNKIQKMETGLWNLSVQNNDMATYTQRSVMAVTTQGTPWLNQRVVTCFECGAQGHYQKDCPNVKNQNHGNKARVPDARGKAYVLGGGDTNPSSNTVTGTFLLNDHHAYMLFDSGSDRSFVSNTFSTLLDITLSALDVSYAVELADGRTS
nr:reverse transcriptase domain-containing protein [Tanacetum cinerariifolium]